MAAAMARLGTESAFAVLARAEALRRAGHDIINLGIGAPDFRTPHHIVAAGQKALADGYHFYTPAKGLLDVREAVRDDVAMRRGVVVDVETIMLVPGGKPTMFFAIQMFGEPGAEIMYPNPGFPIYESMISYTGATPVPVELREDHAFGFDAERVLGQITDRTRLLIVNSPANPTGGVIDEPSLRQLAKGLADHPHVAILSDEIYSRVVYDGVLHASLLAHPELRDRLIMLDGWSKTYSMTGWRLGYGIWPAAFIDDAERLQINSNSCASAAVQVAGAAALRGPQDDVETMVEAFERRRQLIVDGLNSLPGVTCVMPGGAFYAFANITGTGIGSAEMEERLLTEAGVAVIAGTSFGAFGEGFLRLGYAAAPENIERAINRMAQLLS